VQPPFSSAIGSASPDMRRGAVFRLGLSGLPRLIPLKWRGQACPRPLSDPIMKDNLTGPAIEPVQFPFRHVEVARQQAMTFSRCIGRMSWISRAVQFFLSQDRATSFSQRECASGVRRRYLGANRRPHAERWDAA